MQKQDILVDTARQKIVLEQVEKLSVITVGNLATCQSIFLGEMKIVEIQFVTQDDRTVTFLTEETIPDNIRD